MRYARFLAGWASAEAKQQRKGSADGHRSLVRRQPWRRAMAAPLRPAGRRGFLRMKRARSHACERAVPYPETRATVRAHARARHRAAPLARATCVSCLTPERNECEAESCDRVRKHEKQVTSEFDFERSPRARLWARSLGRRTSEALEGERERKHATDG